MAVLTWDKPGERLYETGTEKGVLYLQKSDGSYDKGEAWNGLIGVTENPSGAEETALYANDKKYAGLRSTEIEEGSITAYTYPDSWALCDGTASLGGTEHPGVFVGQQARRAFGLTWRTAIGNDVMMDDYGYKLHIIYGATASPSEKEYSTINDSPEAIEFSWDFKCTPVEIKDVSGLKPTASMVIDSTKVDPDALAKIEAALYGTENTDPKILTPDEIYAILTEDVEYVYTEATVTTGETIPADTYYERSGTYGSYTYALTEDETFQDGKTYYTRSVA